MSGYQDSNLGPPAPKAGALTGLRYTPFLQSLYFRLRCKGRYLFLTTKYFIVFLFAYIRISLGDHYNNMYTPFINFQNEHIANQSVIYQMMKQNLNNKEI